MGQVDWSVAVFSSRESKEELAATIAAILKASAGRKVVVDVLVNGNRELADGIADVLPSRADGGSECVRVRFLALGDKSNTWNVYLHRIWNGNAITFFVDGYVKVARDSLVFLDDFLRGTPVALAATGVPTVGRTATRLRDQMISEGGIHGNPYAIDEKTLLELRFRGFRLPLGLYRTDSLIGAVLCFGLDPGGYEWGTDRILVNSMATWGMVRSPDLSAAAIVGQFKRVLRQAEGELENRAYRWHLALLRPPPEQLPKTAREMVQSWIAAYTMRAFLLFVRGPLALWAWKRLDRFRDWSLAEQDPLLAHRFGQ